MKKSATVKLTYEEMLALRHDEDSWNSLTSPAYQRRMWRALERARFKLTCALLEVNR